MSTPWVYELIGYVASVLVAISLMMSSILKLRVINLAGAVTFTAYGLLIGAYPVAAVNAFIVGVNVYYLRQIRKTDEYFRLLEVDRDDPYLRYFIDFHAAGIRRYLPRFEYRPAPDALAVFVLRDLVPAGLFIGTVREPGVLEVELDFVIPGYRDLRVGRFLFTERADFFHQRGIRRIVSAPGSPEHRDYLVKMGFRPEDGADSGLLVRDVG